MIVEFCRSTCTSFMSRVAIDALKQLQKQLKEAQGVSRVVPSKADTVLTDTTEPADVQVLTSHSGNVKFDVVKSAYKTKDVMESHGFSWDGQVFVRVHVGFGSRIEDLWATGAVRRLYHNQRTNRVCMSLRGIRSKTKCLCNMELLCNANGFVYDYEQSSHRKQMTWSKTMGQSAWKKLDVRFSSIYQQKSSEKNAADEEKREEEAKNALQEISLEIKRAKRLQEMIDGEKNDPTFKIRKYTYGCLLNWMSQTQNYCIGSDGGIDWPAPPVPWEKGIVDEKTKHYAVFPPAYEKYKT